MLLKLDTGGGAGGWYGSTMVRYDGTVVRYGGTLVPYHRTVPSYRIPAYKGVEGGVRLWTTIILEHPVPPCNPLYDGTVRWYCTMVRWYTVRWYGTSVPPYRTTVPSYRTTVYTTPYHAWKPLYKRPRTPTLNLAKP